MSVIIRPLREEDLPEADQIYRNAFRMILRLPDRMMGDANYVRPRFLLDPTAAVAAERDGELVGTNFIVNRGSVTTAGPTSIRPQTWSKGVGQQLMQAVWDIADHRWGSKLSLSMTFPNSPKHMEFVEAAGYVQKQLTAIMTAPVQVGVDLEGPTALELSVQSPSDAEALLLASEEVTDGLYPGMTLRSDITTIRAHGLGETLFLAEGSKVSGFATCHVGANTEAGSGVCYVKFGMVPRGPDGASRFSNLLRAVNRFAAGRGLQKIVAGVNMARRPAYLEMQSRGFRITSLGVGVVRPDIEHYDHPDRWVVDDGR